MFTKRSIMRLVSSRLLSAVFGAGSVMFGPREVPHISADHFAAFGRILHAFARVESLYEAAIMSALELEPFQAAMTLAQSGYEQKKQLLFAIIEESSASADQAKEFKKLIDAISAKSALRNNIAHCVWRGGKRTGSIKPFVIKTKAKLLLLGHSDRERDWIAAELHAEADDLLERASAFKTFLADHGMLPAGTPGEPAQ
ncbi:hypothetical protein [Amorphus sp. MBR-141]